MRATALSSLALGLLAVQPASAWYLPGSSPRSYEAGAKVPFLVNAVTPKAQIDKGGSRGLVSYDYYDPRFHFCQPRGGPQPVSEGLGSALFGDRIYTTAIEAEFLKNETCVKICDVVVPMEEVPFIHDRIREGYSIRYLVDGLPVAQQIMLEDTHEVFYSIGFHLGTTTSNTGEEYGTPAIHNHFDFYIDYHKRGPNEYRIVGASVWPSSRDTLPRKSSGTLNDLSGSDNSLRCNAAVPLFLDEHAKGGSPLAFSYSTHWRESKTPWGTRWDHYLKVIDPKIHLISLVNALVIVGFLCLLVSVILMRSTNRDIHRYEAIDLTEDVQEEFGWKLVHGEVFRPPQSPLLLSVMVGSGTQLFAMATVTLLFAVLGFLSPSNRGSLAFVMIITWTFFGALAGYMSSRVYASLDGANWKRNVFCTATLFPTLVFAVMNFLNFFLIFNRSSGAVPFGTLLALVALWFIINIPLTLLGAYIGIRRGGWRHPARVNSIPRQIPQIQWYLQPWASTIIGGLLPFATGFLELFFMLNSIFGTKVYYAFGFLALTFLVTALTTATVCVLFCYFTLSSEDYRWQWRSFMIGGGSAIWLFAYGIIFWTTRLELPGLANKVLYVGYLFLLSLVDFLLFGSVGYLACYAYVRRIYAAIRID